MSVMKAKMRRLAELVVIGVNGMKISHVSFPNNASKKLEMFFSKESNRGKQFHVFDLVRLKQTIRQLTVKLGGRPQALWVQVVLDKYEHEDNDLQQDSNSCRRQSDEEAPAGQKVQP